MKRIIFSLLLVVGLFQFSAFSQEDPPADEVEAVEQVATPTAPEAPAFQPEAEVVDIPAPDNPYTLEQLVSWSVPIAAGAMALLTFLTGLFPNFTFFKDDRKRDLATKALTIAIIVGIVFVGAGFADGWQIALAFVLSSLGYDKVLNPMGMKTKTKAPAKS